MAKAGLKAIYLSGWQVAAESNTAGATYPDQSLYPVNSVPVLVKRINNVRLRLATQLVDSGPDALHGSTMLAVARPPARPPNLLCPPRPPHPPLPAPSACSCLLSCCLQALQRADQIEYAEGKVTRDYFLPIVADAGGCCACTQHAYTVFQPLQRCMGQRPCCWATHCG